MNRLNDDDLLTSWWAGFVTNVYLCFLYSISDSCEYRNLANTHLDVVKRLVLRLIHYQKRALPVWFPERDCEANPAMHGGFWSPWSSSKANKVILQEVIDNITSFGERKHFCQGNCTTHTTNVGKVSLSTPKDKEFYQMLNRILRIVDERKKSQIPGPKSKIKV